jgi:ribosomal protein L7Ae-like RNA K-turn-binding protein
MEKVRLQKITKLFNNSLKHVGKKQVLKAIIFSPTKTRCVVLAADADSDVIDPIIDLCLKKNVQVYQVENKKDLGNFAGVDVNTSAVAVMN